MKNTIGTALSLTLFGESHGPAVGVVMDGLAPGIAVNEDEIAFDMAKRRAKGALSTARQEADAVEFLSGVYRGHTTGTPLCLVIRNRSIRPDDYAAGRDIPRPGHADYTGRAKYFGYEDPRGGGHFSGRLTAPLVAAGALCRHILSLRGITVGTHLARCAGIDDDPYPGDEAALATALQALNAKPFAVLNDGAARAMKQAILRAKEAGDSVGGILETAVTGLPAGAGEPFFGTVEGVLSSLLFSIPGVKGVSFGLGFDFSDALGSEVRDEWVQNGGRTATRTNHNGGINGGITNAMPLLVRCVVKPTPSIARPCRTANLATGEETELSVRGRHDPCILHRARAVADAVCAAGLVDLLSQRYGTLWQNPMLSSGGTK